MSRTRSARVVPGMDQATIAHARPSQAASLRVKAARPTSSPSTSSRGSPSRLRGGRVARRGDRARRLIRRQAARTIAVNGIVESGSAEWRTSGR
ncbi:MAG: hypothetical protein E6J17_07005 [Chloroflexi bacterium]|nr:MAG: hypothetical protein E6J17_07005 [Chloroflexota bacterium]